MKPTPLHIAAAVALSPILLLSMSFFDLPSGHGQEPKAATPGDAYSAIHCIGCHGGPDTPAYKAYSEDKKNNPTQFVRLTEYHTWHDDDLHAKAFANIEPKEKDGPAGESNLAWRMQQVLAGSSNRGPEYRVDRAAECLTCHSVDRKPGPLANATADRFQTATGVSCEACHGFAERWFGPHVQATWREVAPEEKGKLGLVDLRDPYTRAVKCASCHVGNKEEGKFVTHEIYAAGHPPLPPFELVTYCRDAPRHYFTHRENKTLAGMKPEQQARLHYRDPEKECPEARNLAIGTLAGFEVTMHLLDRDADEAAKTGNLLDFAHFDCYACHHDLHADGDRQPRPGLRPGRPTMRPWSTDTLQVVLKHGESAPGPKIGEFAEKTTGFVDGLKKLNAAFDSRPFGDAKAVSETAAALADMCGKSRPELARIEYNPAETRRLYELMAARVRNSTANFDHETAQQLAWALVVLQNELRDAKAPGVASDTKSVDAVREKLNAIVAMSLRGKPGEAIGPRVRSRQEEIGRFRPKEFAARSDELLKAFDGK
jgi:Cytochrome c554 and c-prime